MFLLLSTTYLSFLYTPLGLRCTGFWRFYTPSAPLGLLEAGAQCAPYKCTFQSSSHLTVKQDSFSYDETEFFLETVLVNEMVYTSYHSRGLTNSSVKAWIWQSKPSGEQL